MPRYATYQLRWSEQTQNYVLSIGNQISAEAITSDWPEHVTSFSFHSRSGIHYTVRKQRVQRGSSYWYAYRRLHGRVVKRYLGRTTDLTFARLEEVARNLEITSNSGQQTPDQEAALSQSALLILNREGSERTSSLETFPLLLSKLSPPRLHAFLLDRSHLFTLLDAGQECNLTLLSAPAGYGKTTLVCQWMAARHAHPDFPQVAWISLETTDNDPLRFWRYLITACQVFRVDLQEVQTALRGVVPQPPFMPSDFSTVLASLLNALAQCVSQGILVLEDYHVIAAQEIHETLSFFLEHLPPTFHLIMITRSDPPFSLARLRARNMLYEIRTPDLRFSQEETAILLDRALSFELSASTIQHLHAQVQGWGAGLHLLKLALQRTTTATERERALARFSQNNASLQEYFVTEVLDLQTEQVQQFLLQSSLLTRLTGSLCDAVTEQHNSHAVLPQLERNNLFLEQIDAITLHPQQATQQWYQYHGLFAEAMRNEAHHRFSEEQLHQLLLRASHWYEMHGFLHEAIEAALSAQNYKRAANLIFRSIEDRIFPGEIQEPHTLRHWLEQFPETLLEQYPALCLTYATTLLFENASWQPDALTLPLLEKLLHMAEQRFRMENQLPKLGELFAFRSLLALREGNMQAATSNAKQALNWLAQNQSIWRGSTLSIVAEEWIATGHFQQAHAALLEAQTLCEAAKNDYFQRVVLLKLAQVFFEQGEIQQATSCYRRVLTEVREKEQTKTLAHWYCVALLGRATLFYECNELASAYQHVQETVAVSQAHNLLHHEVRATLILACVQQAEGEVLVAQQQLADLLERVPVSLPYLIQEIQTVQARLALSLDDHMTVQRWATGRSPHADFSQAQGEELLLSRWLRVQGKLEEASDLLHRLLITTQKAGNTRRVLEAQVEMVLVAAARKRRTEAQHLLSEVLTQTFDGNAVRLFLDAGEQMAILLRSLLSQVHDQALLAYIRSLLNAFPASHKIGMQAQTVSLIEPLSPQEMRVLRLLVQHRSNAEIANELVVSVNTVRSQVQSIYNKLGVHTRSAAGEVAHQLRLIS